VGGEKTNFMSRLRSLVNDRFWSERDAEGVQLALIDAVSQTGEPVQRNQKVQWVEFPLHFLG
jgi:hypothetical protein